MHSEYYATYKIMYNDTWFRKSNLQVKPTSKLTRNDIKSKKKTFIRLFPTHSSKLRAFNTPSTMLNISSVKCRINAELNTRKLNHPVSCDLFKSLDHYNTICLSTLVLK